MITSSREVFCRFPYNIFYEKHNILKNLEYKNSIFRYLEIEIKNILSL